MADRNTIEAKLADEVHRREYECGEALAQPAGPGRLAAIAKADAAVVKAQQAYQDCLDGSGTRTPFKR